MSEKVVSSSSTNNTNASYTGTDYNKYSPVAAARDGNFGLGGRGIKERM